MTKPSRHALHTLLITYEFTFSTFSGNGILARSLVKSLLVHHGCRVTVWCCKPADDKSYNQQQKDDEETAASLLSIEDPETRKRLTIYATELSPEAGWRRLDASSGWKEFTFDNLDVQTREVLLDKSFQQSIDCISVVDWTGAHALRSLLKGSSGCDNTNSKMPILLQHIPVVYLNFRVYSSGITDTKECEWYNDMEKEALKGADSILALSEKDGASLRGLLILNSPDDDDDDNDDTSKSKSSSSRPKNVEILLPCLRGDMEQLALSLSSNLTQQQHLLPELLEDKIKDIAEQQRCFITCVVRLSPEKNAMRFVTFCQALRDDIIRLGYVPVLAGSASDPLYAQQVKSKLQEVCPEAVIVESFLDSRSLAAIFSRTALNFHPCAYDAYGMTVIESAAFGVPSVVASEGHVGATAIVGDDASIQVPLENSCELSETAIERIRSTMNDRKRLETIGTRARECALAWDEAAYGRELLRCIHQLIAKRKKDQNDVECS